MDSLFKEVKSAGYMRKGNKVNMNEVMESLDAMLLADLEASILAYSDYEAVSDETYNDYKLTCARLEILNQLGYLSDDELDAMRQTAAKMRLAKLEEMEHEEN